MMKDMLCETAYFYTTNVKENFIKIKIKSERKFTKTIDKHIAGCYTSDKERNLQINKEKYESLFLKMYITE